MEDSNRNSYTFEFCAAIILIVLFFACLTSLVVSDPPKRWVEEGERYRAKKALEQKSYPSY